MHLKSVWLKQILVSKTETKELHNNKKNVNNKIPLKNDQNLEPKYYA